MIGIAGVSAGLTDVHPHMLRHSCGYYLANTGVDLRTMQDYLGHPRSQTHGALHARGRAPVRRAVVGWAVGQEVTAVVAVAKAGPCYQDGGE